ncbi:MAG: alpha/beta hydrolase [Pseudomonadota bacterium]
MGFNTFPTDEMAALLERLAAEDGHLPDPTTLPAAEGRAQSETLTQRWNVDLPPMADVQKLPLGLAQPGRLLVPHNDEGLGALLYIHGGGWAFGSATTHERLARCLAVAAAAPVAVFSYRLAPENPYPAGLDDCRTAWNAFRDLMGRPALALAGDSAGANLALATMLAAQPDAQPTTALLFYGVYGNSFETPSYEAFDNAPVLTRSKMERFFDWYVAKELRHDPLVAPLLATDEALASLPPLFISAAGIDPLRSESEALYQRLLSLGRRDSFHMHEGVVHGFLQMSSVLQEANRAIDLAGQGFQKAALSAR